MSILAFVFYDHMVTINVSCETFIRFIAEMSMAALPLPQPSQPVLIYRRGSLFLFTVAARLISCRDGHL
jgi:hypothetical protein